MPMYRIGCDSCGAEKDIFRSLSQYNDLPNCCDEPMTRRVCAPAVLADINPYRSMATGEMITGRRQHREHLKNHGLIEVGNEVNSSKPSPQRRDIKNDIAEACHKVLG